MDPFTCRAALNVYMNVCRLSKISVRRYANKLRPRPENRGTVRALRHFDEFYASVFGDAWPSVRLALLCPNKPCAVLNSFLDERGAREVHRRLQDTGALSLRNLCERRAAAAAKAAGGEHGGNEELSSSFDLVEPDNPASEAKEEGSAAAAFDEGSRYMPPDSGAATSLMSFVPSSRLVYQEEQISEDLYHGFYKPDADLQLPLKRWPLREDVFPGELQVAMFGTGDISSFPRPRRTGQDRLLDYYLMDGASVLPVLALDLQKGDDVADLCAAPGGKLLATMMTGLPGSMVACDSSPSRVARLRECLQSYLPEAQLRKVAVLHRDILTPGNLGQQSYDKVLLDVPCTNDRLSVSEDDQNWFGHRRLQERLSLPQRQMALLCQALPLLRPGGSLVYSTCALSPVQNDGVVHMALQQLWQQSSARYALVDLSETFAPLPFRFFGGCRYGQLALPFLPNNVGPLYVARIERLR
ncbi:5-methylcytosine rRNA methyltransferase l(2)10685 [Haemaphysalis longicornis]